MGKYVLKKIILYPFVLLILITISFFMIRLAPGDPFATERGMAPEVKQALMERYHLDQPLLIQYMYFLGTLMQGDLGPSLKQKERTVNEIIAQTLPPSLYLGALALLFALFFGLGAGIFSALKHNSLLDLGTMSCAVLGISLPTFLIGPMLQIVFSIHWNLFPLSGYEGGKLSHMILPAITLALPFAARIARLMRAGMLDILQEDFIRTARAKGLSEMAIVIRHALRGGILPVVSFLGPAIASITTGSLVVEKIFQIPGLGREFVESALNRDYTLVLGTVILFGTFIIFFNLLTDILYGFLDPRVRLT